MDGKLLGRALEVIRKKMLVVSAYAEKVEIKAKFKRFWLFFLPFVLL